jgi:2-polyprenyl-3-methyl-5-hydroxy-6-metoxy-1,4-benzoquinol methylase
VTDAFVPHDVEWTEEKVSRFWDYLGRNHASEFFSEKHRRDLVNRLLRAARPASAVDIGCGTGALVGELARRGVTASGIDSSPDLLEVARLQVPQATFHLGTITQIPLADGTVDAAVLIEVVEHLDDTTLASTLREAIRILKPGGTLMVTTPNSEDLESSLRQCPDCGAQFHIYQHVRRWTPDSLASALVAAGFRNIRVFAFRPVEDGPLWHRVARIAWYRLRRQVPRLGALAERGASSRVGNH